MNLRVIITVKTKLAFKFILEGIFKKKKRDCSATISILFLVQS